MAVAKSMRVYADTSVFGGCLDPEFASHSLHLFELVGLGHITLLLSDVVLQELAPAPAEVRAVLQRLPTTSVERVTLSGEVLALRNAYIESAIVSRRWLDDATHVAAATIARADAIVSWNFRHIVRLDKIKAYNQVNLANGYGILTIISPREVGHDEVGT